MAAPPILTVAQVTRQIKDAVEGNFPYIHVIGEIARPVSLSLRLFGNVTGEDVLLFAFCSLGVTTLAAVGSPVGIPFQVPFILLAFMTSFIQALVFTLLSTIYILLWLPHEHAAEAHH